MVDQRPHWQRVYEERPRERLSWYEAWPERSLALIEAAGVDRDSAILDIGGGASDLGASLVKAGFTDVTVADIAEPALGMAKAELGSSASEIDWVVADAREHDFGREFELWHDRAVFHFMVEERDRDGYLDVLRRALRPNGHLVIATFGPQGPTECSGLPVNRYGIDELSACLGSEFEPVGSELHLHRTPSGREQQFLWARFRRSESQLG